MILKSHFSAPGDIAHCRASRPTVAINEDENMIDTFEAANILQCSPKTIIKLMYSGKLSKFKVMGKAYTTEASVYQYKQTRQEWKGNRLPKQEISHVDDMQNKFIRGKL